MTNMSAKASRVAYREMSLHLGRLHSMASMHSNFECCSSMQPQSACHQLTTRKQVFSLWNIYAVSGLSHWIGAWVRGYTEICVSPGDWGTTEETTASNVKKEYILKQHRVILVLLLHGVKQYSKASSFIGDCSLALLKGLLDFQSLQTWDAFVALLCSIFYNSLSQRRV